MRASVVSFFASGNLGDLLLARGLATMVGEYADVTPLALSRTPRVLTDLDGLTPQLVASNNSASVLRRLPLVAAARKLLRPAARSVVQALRGDLLVIGGGQLMFDVDARGDSAGVIAHIVAGARAARMEAVALDVGIGPFTTREQHRRAVAALDSCSHITFRDELSLALWHELRPNRQAGLAIDPVFRMPRLIEGVSPGAGVVAINVLDQRLFGCTAAEHRLAIARFEGWVRAIAAATNRPIVLFSTEMGDYPAIIEVARRVPEARVQLITGLSALMALYKTAELVVSCRMHPMIVAVTQQLPVVGISWQPKVDAFFNLIDRGDDYVGIDDDEAQQQIVDLCVRSLATADDTSEARARRLADLLTRGQVDHEVLASVTR